jgi:hypothetical protein
MRTGGAGRFTETSMPTVEERYAAATDYVRRAIATVETQGIGFSTDPVTGLAEWYAGRTKSSPVRDELSRLQGRWLRATSDNERTTVARDAELLADRTQEALPGAPQDRMRTNLARDEKPTSTPATSYEGEVKKQATEVGGWVADKASSFVDGATAIGKWLLVGGAVFGGWKLVSYLRAEQRSAASSTKRQLNTNLVRAAERRDASGAPHRQYELRLTEGELRALDFLRWRYQSAKVFVDGLLPRDEASEQALAGEFARETGPYRYYVSSAVVRKTLRATKRDGGDYGTIPNLNSPEIASTLAYELGRS